MARIAGSIQTLADEIWAISPKTTIYFYDNDTTPNSDHDPNDYGVICACDIMQGNGLDLGKLAQQIVDSRHPECKYVIYSRRIASRKTNWEWVEYKGPNPHTDHIHVSVGVGPDAHSEPPYDSTRGWLDMALTSTEKTALSNLHEYVDPRVEALALGSDKIIRGKDKGKVMWAVAAIKQLQKDIAEIKARPQATVDVQALADALEVRLDEGATVEQIRELLNQVRLQA